MLRVKLIQGGMGVGISNYRLSRAVALKGGSSAAGTVSVTMIAHIAKMRLMRADPDQVRALSKFGELFPQVAEQIRARFVDTTAALPAYTLEPPPLLRWMTIFGAFAEVWLASEGHDYPIGANALHEVGYPHLDELVGIMLAARLRSPYAATYLIMGAGLPTDIPGMMSELAHTHRATFLHHIEGSPVGQYMTFDLEELTEGLDAESRSTAARSDLLTVPLFYPIVTTALAAELLVKRASGPVDGFIVEGHEAGGHNAPPRKKRQRGGPFEYGTKDQMDFIRLKTLRLPFWLAGGWLTKLNEALEVGARGIQVGGPFSLVEESGTRLDIRNDTLHEITAGTFAVLPTDRSPTGYPFQVVQRAGTMSEDESVRKPGCTQCYLRRPVRGLSTRGKPTIVYLCNADPLYEQRGGTASNPDSACLCNGLAASAGLLEDVTIPYIQTAGLHMARDTLFVLHHAGLEGPSVGALQVGHVIDAVLEQL